MDALHLASNYHPRAGYAHVKTDDQEVRTIPSDIVLERRLRVTEQGIKSSAGDTVIDFEDLYALGQPMGPLPSGYMGFTWSDSAWVTNKVFSASVCGGRAGLLNADGRDVTIESKHLFDLKELSLCALWADKADVGVEGWVKEVRKYATTQTVSRASIIQCALDYRGVDRVELRAGGKHIMITAMTVLIK